MRSPGVLGGVEEDNALVMGVQGYNPWSETLRDSELRLPDLRSGVSSPCHMCLCNEPDHLSAQGTLVNRITQPGHLHLSPELSVFTVV